MTEDKRKVHTDALETLGTIIDETAKRDAIHLAVEPMIARDELSPGDHVYADGSLYVQQPTAPCGMLMPNGSRTPRSDKPVGIVDPFLKQKVYPGERFWLVLYPRQITSLRHVWEHPAFPPSEGKLIWKLDRQEAEAGDSEIEKSKKWIEDYVSKCQEYEDNINYDYLKYKNLTYTTLMNHAAYWIDHQGEWPDFFYVSENLRDEGLPQEFWHHYEIVTGKKVEEDKKTDFFTCSC